MNYTQVATGGLDLYWYIHHYFGHILGYLLTHSAGRSGVGTCSPKIDTTIH